MSSSRIEANPSVGLKLKRTGGGRRDSRTTERRRATTSLELLPDQRPCAQRSHRAPTSPPTLIPFARSPSCRLGKCASVTAVSCPTSTTSQRASRSGKPPPTCPRRPSSLCLAPTTSVETARRRRLPLSRTARSGLVTCWSSMLRVGGPRAGRR